MSQRWEQKPCKCGSHFIQNRTKWLCSECVFKLNHQGKTRVQVYKERSKPKQRKKTGERDLFLEIWAERAHYCVKCGKFLGHTPRPEFFSHIHSKGSRPDLRLAKENIELNCRECHYIHEFVGDGRN